MDVKFLDCTLRDGAHVNSGEFGKANIRAIVAGLTEASADFVEIGFLKNVEYDSNVTSYPVIEDAYKLIEDIPTNPGVTYTVMARADQYDISKLTKCTGRIKLIRVAFYYDYLERAIEYAMQVRAKGYDFTLNLINTPGNSVGDLEKFIKYANEVKPFAVTIVDTFGVLDVESMLYIARMYDSKLDKAIKVGFHVHENMALAFSLAKSFIGNIGAERDIIVDGSLMGIGRAPGNLCTELITDYLNTSYGKDYHLPDILSLISDIIVPIKGTHKWGYSPEYFLSAKYRVHRSYAEYMSDRDVNLEKIDRILSKIDREHALKYDEKLLLQLMKEEGL